MAYRSRMPAWAGPTPSRCCARWPKRWLAVAAADANLQASSWSGLISGSSPSNWGCARIGEARQLIPADQCSADSNRREVMPISLLNVDDLQEHLFGVLRRSDHHAGDVNEVLLTLSGAILWR